MQNMLNTLGDLYFRLHHARWFTIAVLLALAACAYTIAGARPNETRAFYNVSDFRQDANLSTLLNRYVNISGKLDPSNTLQVRTDVIGVQVRGTRFVGLNVAGRNESIMVLDQNIPTPEADGTVNIIGIIRGQPEGATQYPTYYLEPELPANIPLNNLLARLAIGLAVALVLFVLGGWWVQRMSYALPAGRSALADYQGPPLWFGSLGSRFLNARMRQGPVRDNRLAQETRLDSTAAGAAWSISLRRVHRAVQTVVATSYGPLAALRLTFEDERGLTRQGVLAGSQAEIDRLTKQIQN